VEDLRTGHDKLSEQVPTDSWLGRPLHPRQGTHQQCRGHEAVTVLQGLNQVFPYLYTICWAIFRNEQARNEVGRGLHTLGHSHGEIKYVFIHILCT